jgi:hypothetical protein
MTRAVKRRVKRKSKPKIMAIVLVCLVGSPSTTRRCREDTSSLKATHPTGR